MSFKLAPQLERDTYHLGQHGSIHVLLNRNALFPWFILVPECAVVEFYQLNEVQQSEIVGLINQLSRFIDNKFAIDKLNIATIGNIVSQMHIHVVGRTQNDPCWPGVVWGTQHFSDYSPEVVEKIRVDLYTANICNP